MKQRGRGQPPKGPNGEQVSRYPPLTVRIPPKTKYRLEALSQLLGVPMWELVDRAVRTMFDAMAASDRELLDRFAERRLPGRTRI